MKKDEKMGKKELTIKDISAILRVGSQCGVKKFSLGSLKVEFQETLWNQPQAQLDQKAWPKKFKKTPDEIEEDVKAIKLQDELNRKMFSGEINPEDIDKLVTEAGEQFDIKFDRGTE